jgi:hypothetical protein
MSIRFLAIGQLVADLLGSVRELREFFSISDFMLTVKTAVPEFFGQY